MKEIDEGIQNTNETENNANTNQEEYSLYDIDEYSSEWLQENTTIRGWLLLLLITIVTTSVRTLFNTFTAFIFIENALIFIPTIAILAFAALTIWSFTSRKPSAIFYARCFLIIAAIENFACMISANASDATSGMIKLVIVLVWILFLQMSEVVEEVIPSSFRDVKPIEYIIAGVGFLATIIAFII